MLEWGSYELRTHIHNLRSQSLDELFPSLSDLPVKISDDSERRERGMRTDQKVSDLPMQGKKGFLEYLAVKMDVFCVNSSQNIHLVDLQNDEANQVVEEFTSQYVIKYPPDPVIFRQRISPTENGVEGGVETLEGPTLIWGLQTVRQPEKTNI